MEYAPRMRHIKPSPSAMASARARDMQAAGRDVIALTSGEPDFPTPANVIEAAYRAMLRGETKYTNPDGAPALKDAIGAKFKRENGLTYGRDQIIVGAGARQIIFNAIMSTVAQGDEVIIPSPYWVSYLDQTLVAEGTPVELACPQNNGFKLRPEELEAAIGPKTKWVVLNNPGNPAGAVYTRAELAAISAVLLRHPNVWLLTDDIYEHLIYDGRPFHTMAEVEPRLYDRTLTVNGVSKAYAMTGWRIGYAGGPAPLIKAMLTMQSQATSGASSISQAAAIEALNGPQDFIAERQKIMQARRDMIVDLLDRAPGLACTRPEGSMYVFCSCAGVIGKRTPAGQAIETDRDFAIYLLDAVDVSVIQGDVYGLSPYFRVSFATETELLRNAGLRIQQACAGLR